MAGKLTDTAIKSAKPKSDGSPDKKSDGGGLFLLVNQSGKYWRYSYRYDKKQKTLALGVYPDVGLADARKQHQQARAWLAEGIDPKVARDREKLETIRHHSNTFQSVSEQWLELGYETLVTNVLILNRDDGNSFHIVRIKDIQVRVGNVKVGSTNDQVSR